MYPQFLCNSISLLHIFPGMFFGSTAHRSEWRVNISMLLVKDIFFNAVYKVNSEFPAVVESSKLSVKLM